MIIIRNQKLLFSDFRLLKTILIQSKYTSDSFEKLRIYSLTKTYSENIVLSHLLNNNTNRNILIRFFYLGWPFPKKNIISIFNKQFYQRLISANIITEINSSKVISNYMILPYKGYHFLSDFIYRYNKQKQVKNRGLENNIVYPISPDSLDLWNAAVKNYAGNVLDICTGCGIHAILMSEHCKHVIGIDVNPRAINVAKFNSMLNDTKNIVFRCGDLFEPLPKNIKFDLILANPPYLMKTEKSLLYCDGGKLGDKLLKKIVLKIPNYMNVNGYCQIVCASYETKKGSNLKNKLFQWLGNKPHKILFLKLAEMDIYNYSINISSMYLRNNYSDFSRNVHENVRILKANMIHNISYGVITIQNNPNPDYKEITTTRGTVKNLELEIKAFFNRN